MFKVILSKINHYPNLIKIKINRLHDLIETTNVKLTKINGKLSAFKHVTAKQNVDIVKQQIILNENLIEIANLKLRVSKTKNLVITTYPQLASRNVGDAMITESFIQLMTSFNSDFDCVVVFRETSLEQLDLKYVENIYLPGMTVSPNMYGTVYKLFNKKEDVNRFRFIPIACSFQNVGKEDEAYNINYSDNDLDFLKLISENSGPILCRDERITKLLLSNNVPAKMFGDMVLYDVKKIGKPINYTKMKRIAFSVQHLSKYAEKSESLIKLIQDKFSDKVEINVVFHSAMNKDTIHFKKVLSKIDNLNFVDLSGPASNLDFYDEMDFHIGYRLHGHISFLRRRKPSIVISEDVRSYGIMSSGLFSLGMFKGEECDNEDIMKFLDNSIQCGFKNYEDLFSHIDSIYSNTVEPFFMKISESFNEKNN